MFLFRTTPSFVSSDGSFLKKTALAGCLLSLLLSGCDREPAEPPFNVVPTPSIEIPNEEIQTFTNFILEQSSQRLKLAYQEAETLKERIDQLLASPSESTLAAAQQQWAVAYETFIKGDFLSSEVYQALSQTTPTEGEETILSLAQLNHRINAWPLLGGYLDSVPEYPQSGLVHDIDFELTPSLLLNQNGYMDEYYVTLGYHALEFLLWGLHDNSHLDPINNETNNDTDKENAKSKELKKIKETKEPKENKDIKKRLFSDFLYEKLPKSDFDDDEFAPEMEVHQLSQNRRRQMVQLISRQLTADLRDLSSRWEYEKGFQAQSLADQSAKQQITLFLNALKHDLLDDLVGKQLQPLFADNHDEEMLQSPYSGLSEAHFRAAFAQWHHLLSIQDPELLETDAQAPAMASSKDILNQAISDTLKNHEPSPTPALEDLALTPIEVANVDDHQTQEPNDKQEEKEKSETTGTDEEENSKEESGKENLEKEGNSGTDTASTSETAPEEEKKIKYYFFAQLMHNQNPELHQQFQAQLNVVHQQVNALPEGFMSTHKNTSKEQLIALVEEINKLVDSMDKVAVGFGIKLQANSVKNLAQVQESTEK